MIESGDIAHVLLTFLPVEAQLTLRLLSKSMYATVMHWSPLFLSSTIIRSNLSKLAETAIARCRRLTGSSVVTQFICIERRSAICTLLIRLTIQLLPPIKPSAERSFMITPKCTGIFLMPQASAFAHISEAVSAKNGDCARVQLVSISPATTTNSSFVDSFGTFHMLPFKVYLAYFAAKSPAERVMLSRVSGVNQVLGKYLLKANDDWLAVELSFRGGVDWFLHERFSYSHVSSYSASSSGDEIVLRVEVSNVPRVDSFTFADICGSEPNLERNSAWIVDLWESLLRKEKDLHENLISIE
ncbi:hypothetical protein HK100_012680 [Physocladia obscura]|uniref:Uncharacterized protein n=1 Tax=Physocladia obscura TaxID=109957 RepID=A0AAD5T0W7_9FUNG|nr:hypothetical protein HK100_012680 [Physocladia obscura]